ncbi:MAG TPA: alcohol dehydrogenase catalytic domain-containing protein [Acidimicrobiia bacterium]|jgi:alcohol dehydrogenase|nr:alcohol dehydrogenase catalytic domain-containing protein [Acidimicrobiia bacterium]
MRAARYSEYGAGIDIVELPDPHVPPDGVVVRVEATGVCRSDWHAWQGQDGDVSLPHVPGHEFAGTVVEAGGAVTTLRPGVRVVVPFILGCGDCSWCVSGAAQLCPSQLQPGFHLPGSFAELVAVPRADFNVVPLPPEVTFAAAAALGCRFATAWRALIEQGGLGEGQRLVVFGCGGVGLAAIQIALASGASVTAIDPSAAARSRAESLGASTQAGPPRDSAAFDLALDAIGHHDVAAAGLGVLRPGGKLLQVGILGGAGSAEIPLNRLMRNELEIIGSHGMAAAGFPELISLVASRRLDPAALVTDRVELATGIDHLRHMPQRPGRVVLIEELAH